jgi:hypothetical protein
VPDSFYSPKNLYFKKYVAINMPDLAEVKNVIQDLGGEISIESEEGKGTTVNINIPVLFALNRASCH